MFEMWKPSNARLYRSARASVLFHKLKINVVGLCENPDTRKVAIYRVSIQSFLPVQFPSIPSLLSLILHPHPTSPPSLLCLAGRHRGIAEPRRPSQRHCRTSATSTDERASLYEGAVNPGAVFIQPHSVPCWRPLRRTPSLEDVRSNVIELIFKCYVIY